MSFVTHQQLLQGFPRNALPEDVERFLTGCVYEASSIEMFMRGAFPDAIRMAIVNFPSKNEAMNAFIKKNRGICLNNQISLKRTFELIEAKHLKSISTGNEFFYMIGDNGSDKILMLSLTDSHRLIRMMQLGF
nr:hypothetical protein CFP56_50031 [Quercus suber]